MWGMHHCTAYLCNMNGANSLEEADRWPLDPCPECLAKVCWLTGLTAAEWLRDMLAFCDKHGLKLEAAQLRRSLAAPRLPLEGSIFNPSQLEASEKGPLVVPGTARRSLAGWGVGFPIGGDSLAAGAYDSCRDIGPAAIFSTV